MSMKKLRTMLMYFNAEYNMLFYSFIFFGITSNCLEVICMKEECSGIDSSDEVISDIKSTHAEVSRNQRYFKDLNDTIIQMKKECGDLCEPHSIDIEKDIPDDKTFKRLNKSIDCNKLWVSSIFDQNSNAVFPLQKLPKYLTTHFSQNGQVKILPYYLIDTNNGEDEYMKLGKFYIIY